MKMSNELKTGAVIFAAIAILVTALLKTGDLVVARRGSVVKTRLGYAAGIKKHAPVRLAGVEVGEVQDLRLLYDRDRTGVEVSLWVNDGVRIRRDSTAIVTTLGLMGEKYIEIKPGSSEEFIKDGETIFGKDPVSLEDLIEDLQTLGEDARLAVADFRALMNNANAILEENRPKLSRIMDHLEVTTEYFTEFAEDVRYHPWKVLAKGKEKTPQELEKLRAEREAKKLGLGPPDFKGSNVTPHEKR